MFANRFTVVLDANVLISVLKRNVLLSLAAAELFRPRWSDLILAETETNLAKLFSDKGASDPISTAKSQIARMTDAYPEAEVTGYDELLSSLSNMPDPKDRHVLASAIEVGASTIVTDNLKDFPPDLLRPHHIETRSADQFVADTLDLEIGRSISAIRNMRLRFNRPALTPGALIGQFEANGMLETADFLREYTDSL